MAQGAGGRKAQARNQAERGSGAYPVVDRLPLSQSHAYEAK